MSTLPSEIWARIAYFACTDGGRMGVVLQQVSHLVARGTVFRKDSIVVLKSVRQAEVFERYLRSAERRVECLLLEA
jgi:hypothetical protein